MPNNMNLSKFSSSQHLPLDKLTMHEAAFPQKHPLFHSLEVLSIRCGRNLLIPPKALPIRLLFLFSYLSILFRPTNLLTHNNTEFSRFGRLLSFW